MAQRADDYRTPAEYADHLKVIRDIVMQWNAGEIGVVAKRTLIAEENARYSQGALVRGDTGSDITKNPEVVDQAVFSLADRLMIPVPAAQAALDATRRAGFDAANADSLDEAREILAAGRKAYKDILDTAR